MRVIPQYLKVHDDARGSVVAVPRRWQQVRKDWWNYLKQACVIYDEQDEPPLKLQVKDVICKVEIDIFWAIAKQVAIDFWCWFHDREVYHQPRIDIDILVLIANKLSEYAKNQPWVKGEFILVRMYGLASNMQRELVNVISE